MDHRERVLAALRMRPVDRPPFDLFDECGLLFTGDAYDPARRSSLSVAGQVEARLAPGAAGAWELRQAFFPLAACVWMPWSPHLVRRHGTPPAGEATIEYDIEWDNGLRLPLSMETATGNPSGYETLMHSREEWPLWKQVFTPDFARFDYSHLDRVREATGGSVALYGTPIGPFGAVSLLLGLERAATVFLDDPGFAEELMRFFTEAAIEVCRDMFRHGVDVVRVGAASDAVLGPALYERFVLPWHRRMSAAIHEAGGPAILHCCGHVNAMLESFARAGWDGLEPLTPPPLGDVTLEEAWRRIGGAVCLKGNLDPVHLMRFGTTRAVELETRRCLAIGGRDGGYILSVADCMAAGTPRSHMRIVSDIVHGGEG